MFCFPGAAVQRKQNGEQKSDMPILWSRRHRRKNTNPSDLIRPPLEFLTFSLGDVFLLRRKGKPICFIKNTTPVAT